MENFKSFVLKNNFVVVDLETTGLNPSPKEGEPCKIIEIGAVKIENGILTEKFSTFCACSTHIPPLITAITGICDKDLIGAPSVADSLIKLNDFCKDYFLVGHNVRFDLSFLNHYGKEIGVSFNQQNFDTVCLARKLVKGLENYKLNTVAKHFNVDFRHHRALDDAIATAQIFLALANSSHPQSP